MEITKLELIAEAKKQVNQLSKETKSLWQNDAYNVCFIENTKGELVISKIQVGWKTECPCVIIGNEPMTRKQVMGTLEYAEEMEKQYIEEQEMNNQMYQINI